MNEKENLSVVENRVGYIEKRVDHIDNVIEKIWSKIDEYRNGQIVTQTIVESIRKDMNDSRIENAKVFDKLNDKLDGLKTDITKSDIQRLQSESSNNEKQSGKWETLWSKIATGVLGILVTILLIKLGFK